MNSMILHELYFDGLGGEGEPTGALAEAIARDFGSVERWEAEFSAMGKALGGGSGWVLLTYSPRDKRLVNHLGRRPHHDAGRRPADPGARHVRARLSHGLRRQGRAPMSTPSCRASAGATRPPSTSALPRKPEGVDHGENLRGRRDCGRCHQRSGANDQLRQRSPRAPPPRAGFAAARAAARRAGRSRPMRARPAAECAEAIRIGAFPWCVKQGTALADGCVEVKFKPLSGREDQAGGVVWRWKDGDNYYVARANALENNVSLYYTERGTPQDDQVRRRAGRRDAWHTLRVEFARHADRACRSTASASSSWTTATSPAQARSASGPRPTASRPSTISVIRPRLRAAQGTARGRRQEASHALEIDLDRRCSSPGLF